MQFNKNPGLGNPQQMGNSYPGQVDPSKIYLYKYIEIGSFSKQRFGNRIAYYPLDSPSSSSSSPFSSELYTVGLQQRGGNLSAYEQFLPHLQRQQMQPKMVSLSHQSTEGSIAKLFIR